MTMQWKIGKPCWLVGGRLVGEAEFTMPKFQSAYKGVATEQLFPITADGVTIAWIRAGYEDLVRSAPEFYEALKKVAATSAAALDGR